MGQLGQKGTIQWRLASVELDAPEHDFPEASSLLPNCLQDVKPAFGPSGFRDHLFWVRRPKDALGQAPQPTPGVRVNPTDLVCHR